MFKEELKVFNMIPKNNLEHKNKIKNRMLMLESQMEEKMNNIHLGKNRDNEMRLLRQAFNSTGNAKKIMWLRRAAETATESFYETAACRKGCSHCCNIAVTVSKSEAEFISKEINRPINVKAGVKHGENENNPRQEQCKEFFGVPCTFLLNGECSIYEFRPLACRLQMNMDNDELLCILVEDDMPIVPYLDMNLHHYVAASILGDCHDDIRNWFKV